MARKKSYKARNSKPLQPQYAKPYQPTQTQIEPNQIITPTPNQIEALTKQYARSTYDLLTKVANGRNRALYNPILAEDYNQSINSSKRLPSQQDIELWISSPEHFDSELRGLSDYFDDTIMQYKRSLAHFKDILTFRYTLNLQDEFEDSEMSDVLASRKEAMKFLRDFNVKYHSDYIMDRFTKYGGGFFYLTETKDYKTLLELPIDYCYITGRWDRGFTFALDLSWFDKFAGTKNMMPELYEQYKLFITMRESGLRGENLGVYQYFPIPIEKGLCVTFGQFDQDVIPPFTGVFRDASQIFVYKSLLKQKTALETWKIIAQQIPLNKDDQPILTAEQAQIFVDFAQSVLPDGSAVFATPMDVKQIDFNSSRANDEMVGLGETLYWRSIGVNGTMMDAGDKSALTLKYSLINDASFVESAYAELECFLNLQLRLISRNWRWAVKFFGNKYTQEDDIKLQKDLVATANVPISPLYAYMGYEPFEIKSQLMIEEKLGFKTIATPIQTSYQQSADSGSETGRPKSDSSQLGDAGLATREAGSNETR